MHYACLVVGPDPEKQMEPFWQEKEVSPYKEFLDADEVALLAKEYGLSQTDLPALADRLRAWSGSEGGVEEGRLFRWSKANPKGEWDWFEVGGRFENALVLKAPLQPSRWRRLLGAKPRAKVDQARRSDIQEGPLLAEPPTAILWNGTWSECPFTLDDEEILEAWRLEFARIFAAVPQDALLTIIDCHS